MPQGSDSRDTRVYLEDILEAAGKIRLYTAGLSFEAFCDGWQRHSSPGFGEIHSYLKDTINNDKFGS